MENVSEVKANGIDNELGSRAMMDVVMTDDNGEVVNVPMSDMADLESMNDGASEGDKIDYSKSFDTTAYIGDLLAAMARAKVRMQSTTVGKDASNPHFKSEYATLDATLEKFTIPYAHEGVTLTQFPYKVGDDKIQLGSLLAHSSGQKIWSIYPLKWNDDPQKLGSQITYAKRYTSQSIIGIAPGNDDDAESAVRKAEVLPASWINAFLDKLKKTDGKERDQTMADFFSLSNPLSFLKNDHPQMFKAQEDLRKNKLGCNFNLPTKGIVEIVETYRDEILSEKVSVEDQLFEQQSLHYASLIQDMMKAGQEKFLISFFNDESRKGKVRFTSEHQVKMMPVLSKFLDDKKIPKKTQYELFPFLNPKAASEEDTQTEPAASQEE